MNTAARITGALACLASVVAWADGAFPDSQNLFAPADQPNRILLSTNFGLMQSVDNGQHFDIFCEIGELAPNAFLYQVGPPPDHRLTAVSENGLSYSDDDGCDWAVTDGGIPANSIIDAFMDPSDGTHILAIAGLVLPDGGIPPEAIFESHTGGANFNPTYLYSAPPAAPLPSFITGVEISASQPSTYYATMYTVHSGGTYQPFVVRSDNAGATWVVNDVTSQLGSVTLRLAAVSPIDPTVVYLRQTSPNDALVIATDGGAIATRALSLNGGELMSAFLRRADGTLLVCQRTTADGGHDGCYESTDDGGSWNEYLWNLHVRALAERDGGLFVAADNYQDGFAVGALQGDGGIQPLVQYQGICDLEQCGAIPTKCAQWWINQQTLLRIPPTVCGKMPPPPVDAGTDGGSGNPPPKGCGCSTRAAPALLFALVLLAVGLRRRRRPTQPNRAA